MKPTMFHRRGRTRRKPHTYHILNNMQLTLLYDQYSTVQ